MLTCLQQRRLELDLHQLLRRRPDPAQERQPARVRIIIGPLGLMYRGVMDIAFWLLAIPLTALLIRQWLQNRSRTLCERVLANVRRAKRVCYLAMCKEIDEQNHDQGEVFVIPDLEKMFGSDPPPDREMSMVNYLFGKEPSEKEAAQFGATAIKDAAVDWLDGHQSFVELVIQSLKVQMIATKGLGESVDSNNLLSSPIFLKYHESYPEEADLHAYAALVSRMISQTGARRSFQATDEQEADRKRGGCDSS